MSRFAIYKGNVYPLNVRDGNLRLRSNVKEEGFKELIDIAGNKHNDIFIKQLSEEDVELAFEIEVLVVFKGEEFQLFSSVSPEDNTVKLISFNPEQAKHYDFQIHEPFVFKKEISFDEVEEIIEIRKPILKWEGQPVSKSVIPKESYKAYFELMNK
ncbi:hypothetical protein PQ478_10785 [Alkalihalophilus pseudofirmus]|uniref:hypothetical protein n=1 Tax=Alkalihalophilus pseudofirmus TaxID=79885 RepID=UPI00259BCF80|nr:hypothetical protein [Alkalihalophilus pseudofirmus]WEG18945.1 hypothetical protein PQ478_10785 [Alkalihalophilus pseudofirmus]